MTKVLPKTARARGKCKVCGAKFSYKPIMKGLTRNTCDEHRPKYYGQ